MQLSIPFLLTSLVLQTKLVGRSAESRLPLAIWAGVAPAIAPATMLLIPGIDIAFISYRNVTRVVDWRLHVTGNEAPPFKIFIRR